MSTYVLYERLGWGSAIVEAQLAYYGLPYHLEAVEDVFHSEEARASLRPLNPIHQVPTLVLPSGEVMTESAAITLHLADLTGRDDLVPGPAAPERAAFLRWVVYLVANIYPTFTYADVPSRFVEVEAAQKPFRAALDAYEKRLWTYVEAAAKGPWFLGERSSAMDLYLAVLTRWRPGRPWFAEHTPKVHAAALAAEALPAVQGVIARNFPQAG